MSKINLWGEGFKTENYKILTFSLFNEMELTILVDYFQQFLITEEKKEGGFSQLYGKMKPASPQKEYPRDYPVQNTTDQTEALYQEFKRRVRFPDRIQVSHLGIIFFTNNSQKD